MYPQQTTFMLLLVLALANAAELTEEEIVNIANDVVKNATDTGAFGSDFSNNLFSDLGPYVHLPALG